MKCSSIYTQLPCTSSSPSSTLPGPMVWSQPVGRLSQLSQYTRPESLPRTLYHTTQSFLLNCTGKLCECLIVVCLSFWLLSTDTLTPGNLLSLSCIPPQTNFCGSLMILLRQWISVSILWQFLLTLNKHMTLYGVTASLPKFIPMASMARYSDGSAAFWKTANAIHS